MIDPLPAVALDISSVFPPVQKVAVPVMFAVGKSLTVSVTFVQVETQPVPVFLVCA